MDNIFAVTALNLVEYVFGSYLVFGLVLFFGMIILLLAAKVSPVLSLVLAIPFFGLMITAGWFGEISWVKNVLSMILAFIWGIVLWKLIN